MEDFFHLPPVSSMVHLELRISLWIFEKIWNGPNDILRGFGETDSWKKNQKSKILWHCPFNLLGGGGGGGETVGRGAGLKKKKKN